MLDLDGRLVVSPYLESVDAETVLADRRAHTGLDDLQWQRARVLAEAGALRALFDYLHDRFVLLAATDHGLLEQCWRAPFLMADREAQERAALVRLSAAGVLLNERDLGREYRYESINIEINTHCNFRCTFCPVATQPLPKRLMEDATYALILRQTADAHIPTITLNHYGEPSLDPRLVERMRQARDHGLKVELYSNASHLDEDKLRAIAELANLRTLIVNLPAADPAEFQRLTGWKKLDDVLANLRVAKALGLPVRLSVNLPLSLSPSERAEACQRLTEQTGIRARATRVVSRAGSLEHEEYVRPVNHQGRLNGCFRALTRLSVNVEGRMFLCCQDYRQEYVIGDLRERSLPEIVEGERAVQLRRWIAGGEQAPADFICRRCEDTCSRPNAAQGFALGPVRRIDDAHPAFRGHPVRATWGED